MVINPPANAGHTRNTGSIPGLGRCPGVENGKLFQYYCLESSMHRGAWWGTVLGIAKHSTHTSSVHSLSRVRLFATPQTAACQASLSVTNPQSPPKPMSTESVMSSNHLILCRPLLPPSTFPASRSFQISQLFASGGQSTGVSASASGLPRNIQD